MVGDDGKLWDKEIRHLYQIKNQIKYEIKMINFWWYNLDKGVKRGWEMVEIWDMVETNPSTISPNNLIQPSSSSSVSFFSFLSITSWRKININLWLFNSPPIPTNPFSPLVTDNDDMVDLIDDLVDEDFFFFLFGIGWLKFSTRILVSKYRTCSLLLLSLVLNPLFSSSLTSTFLLKFSYLSYLEINHDL